MADKLAVTWTGTPNLIKCRVKLNNKFKVLATLDRVDKKIRFYDEKILIGSWEIDIPYKIEDRKRTIIKVLYTKSHRLNISEVDSFLSKALSYDKESIVDITKDFVIEDSITDENDIYSAFRGTNERVVVTWKDTKDIVTGTVCYYDDEEYVVRHVIHIDKSTNTMSTMFEGTYPDITDIKVNPDIEKAKYESLLWLYSKGYDDGPGNEYYDAWLLHKYIDKFNLPVFYIEKDGNTDNAIVKVFGHHLDINEKDDTLHYELYIDRDVDRVDISWDITNLTAGNRDSGFMDCVKNDSLINLAMRGFEWAMGTAADKFDEVDCEKDSKLANMFCTKVLHNYDDLKDKAPTPKKKESKKVAKKKGIFGKVGKGMGGMMEKFKKVMFNEVEGIVLDLQTGMPGIKTEDGIVTLEITTLEDSKNTRTFDIVTNPFDMFSMSIPAFAMRTAAKDIAIGDIVITGKADGEGEVKTSQAGFVIDVTTKKGQAAPVVKIRKANGQNATVTLTKNTMFPEPGLPVVKNLMAGMATGTAGGINPAMLMLLNNKKEEEGEGKASNMLMYMMLMNGMGDTGVQGGMMNMMLPMMIAGDDIDMEEMMMMMAIGGGMPGMGSATAGGTANPMAGMMQAMMFAKMMD